MNTGVCQEYAKHLLNFAKKDLRFAKKVVLLAKAPCKITKYCI